MITTKQELHKYLEYERKQYLSDRFLENVKLCLGCNSRYLIWQYQSLLRRTEYYYNSGRKLRYLFYRRKKNKKGAILGIQIEHNVFDIGLVIYHYGSIVINRDVRVGKNCRLHGENCIGNKGTKDEYHVPMIGDNCDIGIGAKILGDVILANDITIGANAVVTKSFTEPNVTLVGIPANPIVRGEKVSYK